MHHMLLYSCQHDFDEKHLNVTGLCYHPNMPRSVQECAGNSAVFAWAVGGVVRESCFIDLLSVSVAWGQGGRGAVPPSWSF